MSAAEFYDDNQYLGGEYPGNQAGLRESIAPYLLSKKSSGHSDPSFGLFVPFEVDDEKIDVDLENIDGIEADQSKIGSMVIRLKEGVGEHKTLIISATGAALLAGAGLMRLRKK